MNKRGIKKPHRKSRSAVLRNKLETLARKEDFEAMNSAWEAVQLYWIQHSEQWKESVHGKPADSLERFESLMHSEHDAQKEDGLIGEEFSAKLVQAWTQVERACEGGSHFGIGKLLNHLSEKQAHYNGIWSTVPAES